MTHRTPAACPAQVLGSHSSSSLFLSSFQNTESVNAAPELRASVCAPRCETDGQNFGDGMTEQHCNLLPTQPSNKKEEQEMMESACSPEGEELNGKGTLNEFRLHKSNDLPVARQHQFVQFSQAG